MSNLTSNLTAEEWATAYVLQFGAEQLYSSGTVSGEVRFLVECASDLGVSNAVHCLRTALRKLGYTRE